MYFSNLPALKAPVDRHPIGRDLDRTLETQNISFSLLRTTTVYLKRFISKQWWIVTQHNELKLHFEQFNFALFLIRLRGMRNYLELFENLGFLYQLFVNKCSCLVYLSSAVSKKVELFLFDLK